MIIDSRRESPFFSRNYGGFTLDQQQYYQQMVQCNERVTILDPMAGQGFLLSDQIYLDQNIILGDLNVAAILLANLRKPEFLTDSEKFLRIAFDYLTKFEGKECYQNRNNVYCDNMLSEPTYNFLQEYRYSLSKLSGVEIETTNDFWQLPDTIKFLFSLPILASRSMCNFRLSDNTTWIIPGSLIRYTDPVEEIKKTLLMWNDYAKSKNTTSQIGHMATYFLDAGNYEDYLLLPRFDHIITSPPYANRMDYSRVWLPELTILSAISDFNIEKYKRKTIGSNIVKDRPYYELSGLNTQTQAELDQIKNDGYHGSSSYYYPYFKQYALELNNTLVQMCRMLEQSGKVVLFVRDTRRKEVLLSVKNIVDNVLINQLSFSVVDQRMKIINSHAGKKQAKKSKSSLFGDAQREWWLCYERR